MEDNKKELTEQEIAALKRKKQLAIIKASNELLEYAKETVKNTDKISDELKRADDIKLLETAIEENKMKAVTYLNASQDEVNNSIYEEASEVEKKKYEERLKKRGITEEQLIKNESATVSFGEKKEKTSKRKHTPLKMKKKDIVATDEHIERLENEDELMRKTMATEKDIIEHKKKLTKQEDKELNKVIESIDSKKVKENENLSKAVNTEKQSYKKSANKGKIVSYNFNSIPENVQYDVIPLPSNGQCYPIDLPIRCGRIPVSYITASDENIIASPNMYRDGKILDIILERKILEPSIKADVTQLVKGDRDAIILWLRANAYTPNYPIIATNPNTDKSYNINVDLSKIKYIDFDLESDENGCFDFVTSKGDVLKFKFLTKKDEDDLINVLYEKTNNNEILNLLKYASHMKEALNNITVINDLDREDIEGCIEDIQTIVRENALEIDDENVIIATVTEQMILNTYSVNGNTDREYIRSYIENLRSPDSFNYRKFINDNVPGVDFKITVDIPESDGGGSFETFLKLSDTVFLNIQ